MRPDETSPQTQTVGTEGVVGSLSGATVA
jgi:hypothetical protein